MKVDIRVHKHGKPSVGGYEVHTLFIDEKNIAFCTVYADGRRTFEFDSERIYSIEEIESILNVGKSLTIST